MILFLPDFVTVDSAKDVQFQLGGRSLTMEMVQELLVHGWDNTGSLI